MAGRTTRNKVRFQAEACFIDLKKAQVHLVQIAALADDRSDYIDKHLPGLVTTLELLIEMTEQFREGM